MNNEEKILELLTKLTGDVAGLKGDVTDLKAAQADMQETLTRVAVTQENTVLPRLQALYEGHGAIMEQLKEKADIDKMYELVGDVPLIKEVVSRHSADIAQLKKAQ